MKSFFFSLLQKINKLLALPLVGVVWIYQHTLSPDHGPLKRLYPHGYCRFYPTCSQYGKEALKKYGLFPGVTKTVGRIVRCNPWNKGGVDLP